MIIAFKAVNNKPIASTTNVIAGSNASNNSITKPPAALVASSNEPFNESRITSANFFAVPDDSLNDFVNFITSGAPDANVANAVTARLSVNPNISSTSVPSSYILFNAGNKSSIDLTEPPNFLDNAEFESASFKKIERKDVPAVDASSPALVNAPKIAVVPSKEKPNCFEIAPTFGNAVLNFSKSSDVLANAVANISVTLAASDASNL